MTEDQIERVARATLSAATQEPTEYEQKVEQKKKDFPNGF